MTQQTPGPRVHERWAHLRLCGAPHKRSYAERTIMRSAPLFDLRTCPVINSLVFWTRFPAPHNSGPPSLS